ncbi:MAG: DUF2946 family protein [Pseudomonadota bacterium]|nr:DUF2946 family protein [Pseudomonadota bacterium]
MKPMPRLRSTPLLTALALLAALLLAVLPTLGRLYQSAQSADNRGDMIAMCTVEGMKDIVLPLLNAISDQATHHPTGNGGATHDCDYCPLLASLVVLVLLALGLAGLARVSPPVFRCGAIRICQRHPCGLGSRGPPVFLRTV